MKRGSQSFLNCKVIRKAPKNRDTHWQSWKISFFSTPRTINVRRLEQNAARERRKRRRGEAGRCDAITRQAFI